MSYEVNLRPETHFLLFQGDKNITKAIEKELQYDDWQLMILHFLGLDHIGHVLGALNPTIDKKLVKMDEIIQRMYEKFVKASNNSRNLVIITGDHGMRDAGGHGGSTRDEILVPLIILGLKCERDDRTYDQTDLATTAAVLMGLNIPESSNGAVIPELLERFNDEERLLVLNYTSERLLKRVIAQLGDSTIGNKGKKCRCFILVIPIPLKMTIFPIKNFMYNSPKPSHHIRNT